jgi:hypothetical protein
MKDWTRQVPMRNEQENVRERPERSPTEWYQASHSAGRIARNLSRCLKMWVARKDRAHGFGSVPPSSHEIVPGLLSENDVGFTNRGFSGRVVDISDKCL